MSVAFQCELEIDCDLVVAEIPFHLCVEGAQPCSAAISPSPGMVLPQPAVGARFLLRNAVVILEPAFRLLLLNTRCCVGQMAFLLAWGQLVR